MSHPAALSRPQPRQIGRKLLICLLIGSLSTAPSGCGNIEQQLTIGALFVAFAAAVGAGSGLVGALLDLDDPKPTPEPSAAPTSMPTPIPTRSTPGRIIANFQIWSPEHTPLAGAVVTLSFRGETTSATSGSDGFARLTLDSRQLLDPAQPLNSYSAEIRVQLAGYQALITSKTVTILAEHLSDSARQSYSGLLSGELQLSP